MSRCRSLEASTSTLMACMSSVQEARILRKGPYTHFSSHQWKSSGFNAEVTQFVRVHVNCISIDQVWQVNEGLFDKGDFFHRGEDAGINVYKQPANWLNVTAWRVTFHSLPFWHQSRLTGTCSAFPVQRWKRNQIKDVLFLLLCFTDYASTTSHWWKAHLYSGHSGLHGRWGGRHLLLHQISQLSLLQLQTLWSQLLVSHAREQNDQEIAGETDHVLLCRF